MSRSTLTMAVAVTVLLVAPLAGAKWMSFGTYEPDTIYDTSKYMVQDDPGVAVNSTVYFNAYHKNYCVVQGSVIGTVNGCWINPNSGQLETHLDPQPLTPLHRQKSWQVIMGVWTDCNGDGYVGLAETAAHEYHARVLTTPLSSVGTTVCPAVNVPSVAGGVYAANGMPNNYNNWVTEFIAIGGADYSGNDERVFFDIEAKVWAEPGVPDAPVGAPPVAGQGCLIGGRTRAEGNEEWGDAHSTGAFLWAVDCKGQRSGVGATDPIGPVPGQPGVGFSIIQIFDGAVAGTGLEFGSDPRNSSSDLNQEVGSENADNGGVIVKAQDCGSGHYGPDENEPGDPSIVNTGTTGPVADVHDLTLLRPVPNDPVNDDPSTWSVPATVNYTVESAPETPGGTPGPGPSRGSDCNFDNDQGRDFYGFFEGNPQRFTTTGKVAAATNFIFREAARGNLPATAIAGGGGGADPNLGVPLLANECIASSCELTQWFTGATLFGAPLLRVDTVDPASSGLPPAEYATFYGYVGSAIQGKWTMPNAGERYGDGPNACGGQLSGEKNNWQCDRNKWYIDSEGNPIRANPTWCNHADPQTPCPGFGRADVQRPLARVHDLFTFRDVDCLDGDLGVGAGADPRFLGGPCARPVSQ